MNTEIEEIWVYNRKKLYFKDGLLDRWEQTEFIDEKALEKCAEALLKAVDVDVKGKFKDKVTTKDKVALVKGLVINEAIGKYGVYSDDYKNNNNTLTDFGKKTLADGYNLMSYGYKLCELPKNTSDTAYSLHQVGYFQGLIAFKMEYFEKSKAHFNRCIESSYEPGASYHYLAESYMGEGDSINYIKTVKEGFEKYPEEEQLIIDLINYYMAKNQIEEAIEYIDIAIAKNADNPSYYSAKATIFDNATDDLNEEYKKLMEEAYDSKKEAFRLRNNPNSKAYKTAVTNRDESLNKALKVVEKIEENLKKAEDLYDESLEIDPKFYNAAYNLGRVYLKRNDRNALHADYLLKIFIKKDFKKSEEFENIAKSQLKTAAEKFEIALNIQPNDLDLMKVLKRIYFRLRDTENSERMEEMINKAEPEENKID